MAQRRGLTQYGRWPFWRGETGAAWEFHGSDGSASAPWLSIHLSRCGLAFTVCLGVVTPVASWCSTVQTVRHRTSPALHVTRKTRSRRLAVAPLHHGAPRCDGCFTPRQTV